MSDIVAPRVSARMPAVPAVSPKQQRFMGAELNRARHGEATQTKMSTTQLEEFAHKPKGGFAGVKKRGK